MRRNPSPAIFMGCVAAGVAACGGSSISAQDENLLSGMGAVVVHVVSRSGAPIPDVEVRLSDGMRDLVITTDGDGQAKFARFPTGPANVGTYENGYHFAIHAVTIAKNSTTEVNLELLRATEATPVLLATHATPADSGWTLTVDLDLAVLGEDGLIIATLTAADFEILGSDCAWMWCVMEATGEPVPAGSYTAEIDAGGFGWTDFATAPPPASATALLLENSTAVLDFDPKWQRSAATHAFLDSVAAPDTVALASYHGSVWMPILETYGPFTSDGTKFHAAINALSSDDAYLNPLHEVFGRMLTWTAAQASGEPQNVVLVSGRRSEPDDGCGGSPYCNHQTRVAMAQSARALALPITGLGGDEVVADIAVRSGGAYVDIEHPEQYAVALQNLKAITSRSLGFNRVRFVLSASADGVFASGHTVWTYAQMRMNADTVLTIPVVVAIP